MQIVIDLPKETYKRFIDEWTGTTDVLQAVRQGTPLPKGHGRLIDEQQIIDRFKPVGKFEYWRIGLDGLVNVLSDAKTIIEADRGE